MSLLANYTNKYKVYQNVLYMMNALFYYFVCDETTARIRTTLNYNLRGQRTHKAISV